MNATIERLLSLGLLLTLLACPLQADSTDISNPVFTLFSRQALAPSSSAVRIYDIARADVFGMSWSVSTTSTTGPACTVTLRYANGAPDTHVIPTSQDGTTYSTTQSISTTDGLTDLAVPPAGSVQVTVSNDDTLPATITIRLFVQ